MRISDVEYHPDQFPDAVFRLKNPKHQHYFSVRPLTNLISHLKGIEKYTFMCGQYSVNEYCRANQYALVTKARPISEISRTN